MKKFLLFISAVFLTATQNISFSQSDSLNNSGNFSGKRAVIANKDYERSGLSEIFLGKHWRDLWTTPFEADVLSLDKFAGGLTPYKRGGGLQTKSLRFKGADGKTYKFRSIDKDPRRVLPPDLQESIFADAFKDQISTSHPFSAVIVAPMMNAVGILNAEPIVVVMPDDDKLGEYKKDFGNVLGTFEENPDDGRDGEKGFAESDKIVNSFKLYKKLEKDNDDRVNSVEFLKARLFDLMIGDWDRHSDQWLWAAYKDDGKTVYEPIPRDRDQAFCLYDGVFPFIAGQSITQIEGYSEDYPKIYDLSFNGRYLDRRLLPPVEKSVYDSLTKVIQSKVTDEVITDAVKKMPAEWYALEGRHLIDMIKSRRDKLQEASDEFYELINETVDIYGSSKAEFIDIKGIENNLVEIKMFKKDKDTGERKKNPFFSRRFDPYITDEIRIYTNGGDDIIKEFGTGTRGIDIKIIKGNGKPKLDVYSADVYYDTRSITDEVKRYEPANEDRGYDWRFGPVMNYNSDDGFILGGGPILYKYGFGATPYVYRMDLLGSYATNAKSWAIRYTGEFYSLIRNAKVFTDVQFTELAITKFFGLGNETPFNEDLDKNDFYKTGQKLFLFSPSVEFPVQKKWSFTINPFYKFSKISYDPGTLLGTDSATYGIGDLKFLGIRSTIKYDTRDHEGEPYKGIYAQLIGNYTPNIFKNNFGYSKAGFDIRAYASTDTVKGFTFAMRTAGGKVWGTFPFYESMFLGGINSLKGFSRERFAGDGLILAQGEIRARLFRVNIIIPGTFGLSAFVGAGRVFLTGEESKKWHSSFGGSAWITYLQRTLNVGLTVAKSDEGFKLFFGTALFL